MSTQRGKGYKADPAGHVYSKFKAVHPARFGAATPLFPNGPMALMPGIYNQVQTSSCGGHAGGGALTTFLRAQGKPPAANVMPLGCYDVSREVDRADSTSSGPLPPLTDDGVAFNELARGLQVYGLELECDRPGALTCTDAGYGDWLTANINVEQKLGEYEVMSARRVLTDWTQIQDGDPTKIAQLVAALQSGFPAIFGVDASIDAFQNYDGNGVLSYNGTNYDHAQYVCGVRVNAAGQYEFYEPNSWGTGWGAGGAAWVDQNSIANFTTNMLIPRLL